VFKRKDRSESHIERTHITIEVSKGERHDKNIGTFQGLSTAGFEEQENLRQEKV